MGIDSLEIILMDLANKVLTGQKIEDTFKFEKTSIFELIEEDLGQHETKNKY